MTLLQFLTDHPGLALFVGGPLILVTGFALSGVVAAPVEAWRKWHRPGDCPRCHGTGREP
jgi:hypothetical protein